MMRYKKDKIKEDQFYIRNHLYILTAISNQKHLAMARCFQGGNGCYSPII